MRTYTLQELLKKTDLIPKKKYEKKELIRNGMFYLNVDKYDEEEVLNKRKEIINKRCHKDISKAAKSIAADPIKMGFENI